MVPAHRVERVRHLELGDLWPLHTLHPFLVERCRARCLFLRTVFHFRVHSAVTSALVGNALCQSAVSPTAVCRSLYYRCYGTTRHIWYHRAWMACVTHRCCQPPPSTDKHGHIAV